MGSRSWSGGQDEPASRFLWGNVLEKKGRMKREKRGMKNGPEKE
jgi:hypothetical protein